MANNQGLAIYDNNNSEWKSYKVLRIRSETFNSRYNLCLIETHDLLIILFGWTFIYYLYTICYHRSFFQLRILLLHTVNFEETQ